MAQGLSTSAAADRMMVALVSGFEHEFGRGAGETLAHGFLEAEEVEFHWDARAQKRWIGAYWSADKQALEHDQVRILGRLDAAGSSR